MDDLLVNKMVLMVYTEQHTPRPNGSTYNINYTRVSPNKIKGFSHPIYFTEMRERCGKEVLF